jgi:putative transposase
MARQSRLAVAGLAHLVSLPALAADPLCVDDEDRRRFHAALRDAAAPLPAAVHAHALLDPQAVLLVTPEQPEALGQLVQSLGRRYVAGFNRRHRRSGPLWSGRFRAAPVQPGTWTLEAMVYVDSLPVQAGLVAQAADYAWSSARHHLGLLRDPAVTDNAAYWQLGNTPFDRELAYRQALAEGLSAPRLQLFADAAARGQALGTTEFLAHLGQAVGRALLPRRRGRPPGKAGPG